MKSIYIPIALLLIGIGLLLGPQKIDLPTDWIDSVNPINWFDDGPATVCIIEETHDRSKLPAGQSALINSLTFPKEIAASGGSFLGCFDKDIVDRDKKAPQELVPYLEAAKAVTLPALVYKRGNKVKAAPLPENENAALEVVR